MRILQNSIKGCFIVISIVFCLGILMGCNKGYSNCVGLGKGNEIRGIMSKETIQEYGLQKEKTDGEVEGSDY